MFALRFIGLAFLVAYSYAMGTQPGPLNALGNFISMLLFIAAPALYFQPTLEAWLRKQPNLTSIFALNALGGWTMVGWLVAFVWALKQPEIASANTVASAPASVPAAAIAASSAAERKCPFCAEMVKSEAKLCRFCRSELPPLEPMPAPEATGVSNDLDASAIAEVKAAAAKEAAKPKGMCPNCNSVIALDSSLCVQCHADFGPGSSWNIRPLPTQQSH